MRISLRPLDFNELLIGNPAATFAVRIAGESMTGAGLFPGGGRFRRVAPRIAQRGSPMAGVRKRLARMDGLEAREPHHRTGVGDDDPAGIDADMCCHTFRATGLTNFLANGGTLENAQAMADHASPRTTQLYDWTGDEITLDEVERIAI